MMKHMKTVNVRQENF